MSGRLRVFVATKGHPFQRDAFEAMLWAIGVDPTMVDHPAAAMLMNTEGMRPYDAVLLYDMPGMDFAVAREERPTWLAPDPAFKAGFEALLDEGKGIVALHHALAGWPAWPRYGEWLGGAFRYKPGRFGDRAAADSGYAADVAYTVARAGVDHPVLEGIPDRFPLTDELYDCEIAERGAVPLLLRETPVAAEHFRSAMDTVRKQPDVPRQRRLHPWLGWAKAAGRSPLVYLQPGDGPATYADPVYRRLVGNALHWVASAEAHMWAQGDET